MADKISFIDGDLTDYPSLVNAIKMSQPDEVYNLAAQSFVGSSFIQPVSTAEIDGLGVVNLLEAIRLIKPDAKFYQASTSELFGGVSSDACDENTPFHPRSPYAVAKLYAHWITKNYHESYGLFACCGILFNHESERRGKEFVTRKITNSVAQIKYGKLDHLELGNLDSKRDWGHANDYIKAMWLMLQQSTPCDYVIATGETHPIRKFVKLAFSDAGYDIKFEGEGLNEVGIDSQTGKVLLRVNEAFYRPNEVNVLLGNPAKAESELGWHREIEFEELVRRMVKHDLKVINSV